MEFIVVGFVSFFIGFLFGVLFYWKVILPHLAKKFLKEMEKRKESYAKFKEEYDDRL